MAETITITVDNRGVADLRLNRPEKHNSLSAQMIAELTEAASRLGSDPAVRVVVLSAEGESFCAGGDLGWMKAQMAAPADERRAGALALAQMLAALDGLPRPLIGRVQGAAYGGGLGVMSVCDLCIGVPGARFGLTETRLGLIPATISPYVIARIGATAARRHFLSGQIFDAAEAHRIGLLSAIVAPDELDDAIAAEVSALMACAPGAVAEAKALVAQLAPPPDAAMIASTVDLLIRRWETAEAAEGVAAFFDRRSPSWRPALAKDKAIPD